MRICIDDCVVQFSVITKELSSDSISLKDLLIGFVILIWTKDILQFGWRMDRRFLKWNYNESLAISLLEILCSSRSSCSSCVLCLWRFVVEVLRGFRGLNPLSFTDLWFVKVSGGFWAWFQWTLRSRQVVWMILLRMFFVFYGGSSSGL